LHASPLGLLGDYRIIREVGRGGMGVVYEAEQISLRRRVALKVLPFAAVLDPKQLQRFKNEALAAAQLDHPNIVDVLGVGCDRATHFYAMRFIDGVTLADAINELRDQSLTRETQSQQSREKTEASKGSKEEEHASHPSLPLLPSVRPAHSPFTPSPT